MTNGGDTVVVAEDEVLTRMFAVEVLEAAGFHVVEVEHAAGALVELHKRDGAIVLLFTDIHMPGEMDGLMLAHHVKRHWPRVALLIASGESRPTRAQLPAGSRFLCKPYESFHLETHARELTAA